MLWFMSCTMYFKLSYTWIKYWFSAMNFVNIYFHKSYKSNKNSTFIVYYQGIQKMKNNNFYIMPTIQVEDNISI